MKKLFKSIITMTLVTVMAGSFMAVSATENNPENYLAGDIVVMAKLILKMQRKFKGTVQTYLQKYEH